MRKLKLTILLAIISYSVLQGTAPTFAVDRGGCLICHRYPGLVKFETPDKFKVLHIDEEKHLASPHGKTDCRQCHPKTVQVPHTNVTDVECTVRCHFEDREKIDAIDPKSLAAFHKEEIFAITRLEDKSSCRVCHPLYPHSENNNVRALLNMHTGFMLCEVCHLKKKNPVNLTYDWKEAEEFEFTGEPYGSHEKEIKEPEKSSSVISKMLKIFSEENDQDETQKTRYLISRIAVFKNEKGKKSLFINVQDNEKAKKFLDKEKNLSREEKEKELNFFHRDIAKKEISVACNECHSPDGILDFEKLGFDENKATDLRYLNIKGLVTKYETFYFPNLFGH